MPVLVTQKSLTKEEGLTVFRDTQTNQLPLQREGWSPHALFSAGFLCTELSALSWGGGRVNQAE